MADDQDETGGMASVKPDYFSGETAGGGGFLPPLAITVDLPDFRYTKLSKIVTEHVLPKLVALHGQPPSPPPAPVTITTRPS